MYYGSFNIITELNIQRRAKIIDASSSYLKYYWKSTVSHHGESLTEVKNLVDEATCHTSSMRSKFDCFQLL